MARPKKYKTKADEESAREFSQNIFREINKQTGLSSSAIAKQLNGEFDISPEMWRQYGNGIRIMNSTNQSLLLRVATGRGWVSSTYLNDRYQTEAQLIPREELDRLRKEYKLMHDQLFGSSIKKLRSSMQMLFEVGWSDAECVAAAIMLSEEFIPKEQLTFGGLVSLFALKEQLGTTSSRPNQAWISWSLEIYPPEEKGNPADQRSAG